MSGRRRCWMLVSLAVAAIVGGGSALAAAASQAPRCLARPLRALLADSNAVSAHVISLYLASWQVDATIVLTIEEATAAWRETSATTPETLFLNI